MRSRALSPLLLFLLHHVSPLLQVWEETIIFMPKTSRMVFLRWGSPQGRAEAREWVPRTAALHWNWCGSARLLLLLRAIPDGRASAPPPAAPPSPTPSSSPSGSPTYTRSPATLCTQVGACAVVVVVVVGGRRCTALHRTSHTSHFLLLLLPRCVCRLPSHSTGALRLSLGRQRSLPGAFACVGACVCVGGGGGGGGR